MKKNYINPQVLILRIDIEQMIAESQMQRGTDPEGGGNNAEVKRERVSTTFTNPVNWEE